jgi:N-acetylmuramoyl-L-alanine amidase
MSRMHSVSQGETMISIAIRYGFSNWRRIWESPRNAQLRQQRGNPHVLAEKDQVFIPDRDERVEKCATGRKHRFVLHKPKAHFRVQLHAEETPFEGHRYRLVIAGETFEGVTGPRGLVEHEVDPRATEGTLTLWLDPDAPDGDSVHVWHLALGSLDPPEKVTGAQAVLHNLGYYDGDINGELDERTREALTEFQLDYDISEPHGVLDDATWTILRNIHEAEV